MIVEIADDRKISFFFRNDFLSFAELIEDRE